MSNLALHTARKLVPVADMRSELRYLQGDTRHIIEVVLEAARKYKPQAAQLARSFSGKTRRDTLYNIWSFLRKNIRYVPDGYTRQDIKSVSRTITDGYADCKGYSILTSAVLQNLGIAHSLRFVSYDRKNPDASHVYVVVSDLPVDACMTNFGVEKPYQYKTDYPMTRISMLTGIGAIPDYEGDLEIALAEEQEALERAIGVQGIGAANIVALAQNSKMAEVRKRAEGKNRAKIPVAHRAQKPEQQAFVKDMLQNKLRQAAPYFMLLFIKDQELIAKLPPAIQAQRKEAVQAARYIALSTGVSDNIIMGTVRNALMAQTKRTPEDLLIEAMAPAKVTGIGFLPAIPAIISALPKVVGVAKTIIGGAKTLFGEKEAKAPISLSAPKPGELASAAPAAKEGFFKQVAEKAKTVLNNLASSKNNNTGVAPQTQQQVTTDLNSGGLPAPTPTDPAPTGRANFFTTFMNGTIFGIPNPVAAAGAAAGAYFLFGKKSKRRKR